MASIGGTIATVAGAVAMTLSSLVLSHSAWAQTSSKIPLTTSMVSSISGGGYPQKLVDEQTAEVPVAGSKTPIYSTNFQPISGSGYTTARAKIDLGKEYVITKIMLYDTNGIISTTSGTSYKVDSLATSTPVNLVSSQLPSYQIWKEFPVNNVKTRYLAVENPGGFGMAEIVLFGYPATGTAPVVASVSNQLAAVGVSKTITVTATDAEGGTITMSAITKPSFVSFSQPSSGKATLTVNAASTNVGIHPITIQAKDSTGLTHQRSFTLNVGHTPLLSAIGNVSIAIGATQTIALSATDVDGGHLTLSTVGTRPAFATFAQSASGVGTITLKPIDGQVGIHSLTVQVKDSIGLYSSRSFTITVTGDIPAGKLTPHYRGSASAQGSAHGFYEYLPGDYATSNKIYPIIVFFHGAGKRGNGLKDPTLTADGKIKEQALGAVITEALPKLIRDGKQLNAIILMPQRYYFNPTTGSSTPGWFPSLTKPFVDFALARHKNRMDPKRVYVTGLSMGGGGTWLWAKGSPTIPAALVAVCGYDTSSGYDILKGVPIWAFHHEEDGTVPYNNTLVKLKQITGVDPELTRPKDNATYVDSKGVTQFYHYTAGWDGAKWNWRRGTARPPANENPILTTYEQKSHNSWDKAYGNADMYEWLFDQAN